MKCTECYSKHGSYREYEDLDSEGVMWFYTEWICSNGHSVYQWDEGFVWPDDEDNDERSLLPSLRR